MTAKQQILRLLRGDTIGFPTSTIATYLGMPQASVRRNLNELQLLGWNIVHRLSSSPAGAGFYVLGTPERNAPATA